MVGSKRILMAVAAAVVLGATSVGALLYVNREPPAKASANTGEKSNLARFAVGAMDKLQTPAEVPPATDYRFLDASGAETGFDAFKGKVAVVNLWAMWCAPCREEMPTLAALAAAYAGNDQVVVAPISVDLPDQVDEARAFIGDNAPLPFYSDPKFRLPFEFAGKGAMPQTILLDRQGRVRAHLTGGADWSGPEAKALIDALLAED